MKVKIVKEVKRSDVLWRFACGDVLVWMLRDILSYHKVITGLFSNQDIPDTFKASLERRNLYSISINGLLLDI